MFDADIRFNGADYVPERDNPRLKTQYDRVFYLMRDQKARTLREIATITGDPESSVSAQLRHMRKERFGSHEVVRERISEGLYTYKLIVNEEEADV